MPSLSDLSKILNNLLACGHDRSDGCDHRGRRRARRLNMTHFTIENETNNITLHATAEDAETVAGAERFSTADDFAELATNWPTARLIEIWNSLPGVTPVKKFTDRATAAGRIWNAIQGLEANIESEPTPEPEGEPEAATEPVPTPEEAEAVAESPEPEANVGEQEPDVAPAAIEPSKKATRSKKPPTSEPKAKGTREGSKTATIVEMLKREGGVTLKGLMDATSWQAHSVRGFISGTLTKKMGLAVMSTKGENGERTYTIGS
jgi:Protein of unknown function (DUF3489)